MTNWRWIDDDDILMLLIGTFEEHVQRNETVSKAYLEPTMLNDNDMAQWYTAKQARKWLNDECCTTVGSVIRRANCMFMHFMLMC